tara:strand:+ start:5516 stop:6097 length:582 start_codon:yes stop_codon:yes gene_type:complete
MYIFNFLLALSISIMLSPFLIILCIAVLLILGTPIFFKQQRPGLNGIPFNFIKFRTMTNKKDKNGNLLPDGERLTSFGEFFRKTSLDELPSLWNVLKGDMGFVGPRPLLIEYLPLYSDEQVRRHEVKPGITGWAQINGRNAISWEEKFELDVWYVDNRSFLIDIKIIIITIWKVLRQEGISQRNHSTMEKFKG